MQGRAEPVGCCRPRRRAVVGDLVEDQILVGGSAGFHQLKSLAPIIESAVKDAGNGNGVSISRRERDRVVGHDEKSAGLNDRAFGKGKVRAVDAEIGNIEGGGCGFVVDLDEGRVGNGRVVHDFVDQKEILRLLGGAGVSDGDEV